MKTCFLFYLLLILCRCEAQEPPVQERANESTNAENRKDDDYIEQLDHFRRHPLSVNTASAEELSVLRILSPLQIAALISYRRSLGSLVDLHELQAVPGWEVETIAQLLPYLTVADPVPPSRQLINRLQGGSVLLLRTGRLLQRARGYGMDSGNRYLGSPNHFLVSYKYQYKNQLYFGLTADKDPGEQFFHGAQSAGFDFYSVHFMIRNLGRIRSLALGDYTVNLGQGLLYWQSDRFGKSDAVLSTTKLPLALAPYRSAGETGFNRGAGVTLGFGRLEATVFGSYKRLSASVDSSDGHFGSLQTSGYYRTASEIAHRNTVRQFLAGGRLAYSLPAGYVALNGLFMQFGNRQMKGDQPYNYFAVDSRRQSGLSLDYAFTKKNGHWFGEAAVDHRAHVAMLAGVLLTVDNRADLAFLYRRLPAAYSGQEGSAFTESSLPSNEEGLYTGLVLRPAAGWQINAYADFYRFAWLRYRVSAPSFGQDFMILATYQPEKRWRLELRYRNRLQPLDGDEGKLVTPLTWTSRNFRLNLNNQLTPKFGIRTRLDLVWLSNGGAREEGFLAYAEGIWKPGWKLGLRARLQYTETGSYASRIYAYESDVLYSFSIPAFAGKLYRYYLVANKELGRMAFWLRWAESVYPGLNNVGSGLDIIKGNRRSEIKAELIFRLGSQGG